MGRPSLGGLTFDAGALIAFEAFDRRIHALILQARDTSRRIVIPAGVLAQVWRGGGPRQARLTGLLHAPNVVVDELTTGRARLIGQLLARTGGSDVVDASVVIAAWTNGRIVVTADVDDIRRLDPGITIVRA